jgi:nicotinate phosphoribosyltransferase
LLGIRLDSGDLAELSIGARKILDQGGFPKAAIVASSDLDEYQITELKRRGAKINIWGVGTRLATAYDQPALGGVYKLAALKDEAGAWDRRIKLSETAEKVSDPGVLQVRRYRQQGRFVGDAIYDEPTGIGPNPTIVDLSGRRRVAIPAADGHDDLLVPIFRRGTKVYEAPSVQEAQRRAAEQLAAMDESVIRLDRPQPYPLGLEERLHNIKTDLMLAASAAVERAKTPLTRPPQTGSTQP